MKRCGAAIAAVIALCLSAAVLLGGCTVSSGVFTGLSQSSTDTSLSASYISFDGSYARLVPLKEGDEVSFSLNGGGSLNAAVQKNGENIFSISDGCTFIAPENEAYTFVMEGDDENGSFTLVWEIE